MKSYDDWIKSARGAKTVNELIDLNVEYAAYMHTSIERMKEVRIQIDNLNTEMNSLKRLHGSDIGLPHFEYVVRERIGELVLKQGGCPPLDSKQSGDNNEY